MGDSEYVRSRFRTTRLRTGAEFPVSRTLLARFMPARSSSRFPIFVQTRASVCRLLGDSKSPHRVFRTANFCAFFGSDPLPHAPLAFFFRRARDGARLVRRALVLSFAFPRRAKCLFYAFFSAQMIANILFFPFTNASFAFAYVTTDGTCSPVFYLA